MKRPETPEVRRYRQLIRQQLDDLARLEDIKRRQREAGDDDEPTDA